MIESFKLTVFLVFAESMMHRTPPARFISPSPKYRHKLGHCLGASRLRSSIASIGMLPIRTSD